MYICKYCGSSKHSYPSIRTHQRICPKNVNRKYKNGMTGKKGSNQYIKAKLEGREKPKYDRSHVPLNGAMLASSELKSKWAKDGKTGGYKENAGRSKKFKVIDSYGKETVLQSSYEFLCSNLLNELNIKWCRPSGLKYDGRWYFADFFLPEFNLYLDPKNDYKMKLDEQKIQKVSEQNGINVIVLSKKDLTIENLKRIIDSNIKP